MKKTDKILRIRNIMEELFSVEKPYSNEEYADYLAAQCYRLKTSDLDDVIDVLEETIEQNKKLMELINYAISNNKNIFNREGLNQKLLDRFDIDR